MSLGVSFPTSVGVIRKAYRYDGGGERQTQRLLDTLTTLTRVDLFCLSWELAEHSRQQYTVNLPAQNIESDIQFAEWAIREARENCVWIHGQDWIPGVDSIRLGDGLHSKFLKLVAQSSWVKNFQYLLPKHRAKLELEKKTLESATLKRVMANSSMCMREFETAYPGVADRLVRKVVHNPLSNVILNTELPARGIVGNKLVFGFVGSGFKRKGLDLLIKAFARVSKERAVELYVVGHDRNVKAYKRLACSLGCGSLIKWLGPKESVHNILTDVDVLVHPALYEPYGNVVAEALSMGCFVICSDRVGTQEFIHDGTGQVVPFDLGELTKAMISVPDSWSKSLCRESVSHLTIEYYRSRLEDFFG